MHLLSHIVDFVLSSSSGPTSVAPLVEVLLAQLFTLSQGDLLSTFSVFLHFPCVAFDEGLSRRSLATSKAKPLSQLLAGGLQLSEEEIAPSLTTVVDGVGSGDFVLSLTWKDSLDVLSATGGSSFEGSDSLPPNMAGMSSLVLSLFVFPHMRDRYVPLILSDTYRRELILAALCVLAADEESKGEAKAWLFLEGIQSAFSKFIAIIDCEYLVSDNRRLGQMFGMGPYRCATWSMWEVRCSSASWHRRASIISERVPATTPPDLTISVA